MLARLTNAALAISALTSFASTALAAPAVDVSEDWYQVEVIVFVNRNPIVDAASEFLVPTPRTYPASMVTIEPDSLSSLLPYSPLQIRDLENYYSLWQDGGNEFVSDAPQDDFLFESRSTPTMKSQAPTLNEMDIPDANLDFSLLFQPATPMAYEALPSSLKLLNAMARSIRRSKDYSLLLHKAWRQPILNDDQAKPVLLQAGAHYDDNFELDGTISISRSRFLHVDTNLWLTEFASNFGGQITGSGTPANFSRAPSNFNEGVNGRSNQFGAGETMSAEEQKRYPNAAKWLANRGQYVPISTHQMTQSRRMRSSTVHFLDHPRFGVIVTTQRYQPEDQN